MTADKDWAFSLYDLFARGGDDEQMFYAQIKGDPWSKSRPRFTRTGRTYKPRDDQEAEQRLRWNLKANNARPFKGNVMLVCRFYRSNFQRIDTDNLLKHVCDSANGILWADDSQVTLTIGEIQLDPDNPRTVILAGNHQSSLTRGDDAMIPCQQCDTMFTPAAGRRGKQKFCTHRCAITSRGTNLEEPINCAHCQKPFRRTTSAQTMCSRDCRADSLRDKRKAKAAPKSTCPQCGKELGHTRGGRCRECWRSNPSWPAQQDSLPI